MIQLAWRQFRTQALVAYGLLAVIAVVLAITGPRLVHYYDAYVVTCHVHGDCTSVQNAFLGQWRFVQAVLGPILLLLPALIGMFWGAPLIARELETGTFRLAWTQSLTRRRWLTVKLALLGLASMAAAGLLSLMVTWWFSPLDRMNRNAFSPGVFGDRGIVPIGYAAFAFALGVTAGVLIRRTVPAMAAVILPYIGARLAATFWIRPNLMTPMRLTGPLTLGSPESQVTPPGLGAPNPADWVLSSVTLNKAGQVIGQNGVITMGGGMTGVGFQQRAGGLWLMGVGRCPNIKTTSGPGGLFRQPNAGQTCVDKLGVHQELIFQPISRYWIFQWCELGIFLGAAVLLAGFCFWWVRRRLA
jgi:hypothetical protein